MKKISELRQDLLDAQIRVEHLERVLTDRNRIIFENARLRHTVELMRLALKAADTAIAEHVPGVVEP